MRRIRRVAVLGAGVMGAAIAAQMANAGLQVLLLDMPPKELLEQEKAQGLDFDHPAVKTRAARIGVERALQSKPAPFFRREETALITLGNFQDDMAQIGDCDWVIEAIVEHPQAKASLFEKVAPYLAEHAVFSTNTSGLQIDRLAENLPKNQRSRFLGVHFFNPPRYMRLVELIPGSHTDPALVDEMALFIGRKLGKGIVRGKDTPNFVGNRIGVFSLFNAMQHMVEMDLPLDMVDAVSGPITARPKTAIFRTADLVGIDTLAHVARNSFEQLKGDEARATFEPPAFLQTMVERGLLGDKTGKGFYTRHQGPEGLMFLCLDLKTLEYRPVSQQPTESLQAAAVVPEVAERLRTLLAGTDEVALFAWKNLRDTLIYALNRIPEIAESIEEIDNAMKWGFSWELGPFEMLDAIGIASFVARAEKDGVEVPVALKGVENFYRRQGGREEIWDLVSGRFVPRSQCPEEIRLDLIRDSGGLIEGGENSSLIDLGDGVFCLEFHSKMNSLGPDMLEMCLRAVLKAEAEGTALVIGNRGPVFSAGANLGVLVQAMQQGDVEQVRNVVALFQQTTMALKYARVPVVAAPFNLALGGACEICMHADQITAHAETYMGLVEIGVGLLPAGGGCKEMALQAVARAHLSGTDVSPHLFKAFETIATGKISSCALELYDRGFMGPADSITMDGARLLHDAKVKALALAVNYRPRRHPLGIPAPGRSVAASMKSRLWNLQAGGFISEYDQKIGGIIASILCGGDVPAGTMLNEQYFLELEQEGFLSLCGEQKTQERIVHMLKTGKALRN